MNEIEVNQEKLNEFNRTSDVAKAIGREALNNNPEAKVERYNTFLFDLSNKIKGNPDNILSTDFSGFYNSILEKYGKADSYQGTSCREEDSAGVAAMLLNIKKNKKLEGSISEDENLMIREFLYGPTYNSDRENLREFITTEGQEYNKKGDEFTLTNGDKPEYIFFSAEKVSHLKIFLTHEEKEAIKNNLPDYFKMKSDDFSKFITENNSDLSNIEKTLSSFKKERVFDRADKIRLVRDLRFGRLDMNELKNKVALQEKSLNKNIPAITKLVAPLLLADTPIYIKLTKELGDTADDKQRLLTYLTDTGIPENILESVKNLIF